MNSKKTETIKVRLSPTEREVLNQLADQELVAVSAMVRSLVKQEAKARGLWPIPKQGEVSCN